MNTLPEQPVYVIVPSPGPSIESDRLRLRPVTDSDAPALLAVRSRWEVVQMKYVLDLNSTRISRLTEVAILKFL